MIRLLGKLAVAAVVGSVLFSRPSLSQILPPQNRAEHVAIIKGPEVEFARDDLAFIRWTSTNPGGDDDHFRRHIFWDGSQKPEPDGEIPHQAQTRPCGDDFPCARRRSDAADDLLLRGNLDGGQWSKRWRAEPGQPVHHSCAR